MKYNVGIYSKPEAVNLFCHVVPVRFVDEYGSYHMECKDICLPPTSSSLSPLFFFLFILKSASTQRPWKAIPG